MQTWAWLTSGALILGLVARLQAQPCPGKETSYSPLDNDTVTVSSTPVGLTLAKVQQSAGNAAYALVSVETAPIAVVFVGTPSTSVGNQFIAGSSFYVCGLANIKAFRAIRVSSDATLKVALFKSP